MPTNKTNYRLPGKPTAKLKKKNPYTHVYTERQSLKNICERVYVCVYRNVDGNYCPTFVVHVEGRCGPLKNKKKKMKCSR